MHMIETMWTDIARKFQMEADAIRYHWRSLKDLYRVHCNQEKEGSTRQDISDGKYDKLIEILRCMQGRNGDQSSGSEEADRDNDEDLQTSAEGETIEVKDKRGKSATGLILSSIEQKMTLAQLVHEYEHLWDKEHADYNNIVLKDRTWDAIAASMNVTRDELKYTWKCLRDSYRYRLKRVIKGTLESKSSILQDPLFRLLDEMCAENMKFRSRSIMVKKSEDSAEYEEILINFNEDDKQKLIAIVEQHCNIWNSNHLEYYNLTKRDLTWNTIAEQMRLPKPEVKTLWNNLRNLYRSRTSRLSKGIIDEKSPLLCDPIYVKLQAMFNDSERLKMVPEKKASGWYKATKPMDLTAVESGPFTTLEDKIKLVQEVMRHELLWNSNHVDYHRKLDKRGAAWKQVAAKLGNCTVDEVKVVWRRLRDMHRKCEAHGVYRNTIPNSRHGDTNVKDSLYEMFSIMAKVDGDTANSAVEGVTIQKRPRGEGALTPTGKRKLRFKRNKFADEEGCIKRNRASGTSYEKICEQCGKHVPRSMFEDHMNLHNGLRPHACSFEGCEKRYSTRITRNRHEELIHRADCFKYQCDQCDRKFPHRSAFERHYAIKHKSHQVPCPICGKLLKHKSLLQGHVRLHSGRFPCPVCGKVLMKKYSLSMHLRAHTNEKPFSCKFCDKRFFWKVQFKTHLEKAHDISWEEFLENYGESNSSQT
ncbi:uncharacterized protein LOC134205839 isoform X2 [Armigeres subalbatus]